MGTEYRHFLVVDDAHWRPRHDTAARVEAVLRTWRLLDEIERIVDLSPSQASPTGALHSSAVPGRGIAIVYAGATGLAVQALAGPSYYADITAADRYLKRTTLVIGDDYRVQWSPPGVYFELVSPPLTNGVPIPADDVDLHDCLFDASYPSARATVPPVVVTHVDDSAKPGIAWGSCLGFWQGALILDFGKDLPAFGERVQALPAREFVAALSTAFRGPLVEIGEFY